MAFYSQEKLTELGIVGEPRDLRHADKVQTSCVTCSSSGEAHVNNILTSFKKKSRGWICPSCKKEELSVTAKANASLKNPVDNIRNNLRPDSIDRRISSYKKAVTERSDEEKYRISEQCRVRMLSDNPMFDEEIKKKHWEATHSEEFIEKATAHIREMTSRPDIREKFRKNLLARRLSRPDFFREVDRKWMSSGASPEARQKAVKTIRSRPGGYESVVRKVVDTNIKRYGVQHPMQLPEFIDKMMETKTKNGTHRVSREETAFKDWLVSVLPPDTEVVQSAYLSGKQMDVIVPSKKIAFEYNGLFWHTTECHEDKNYHLNKTLAAEKSGYRLIHVWSDLWKTRRDQYENFIISALGIHKTRYYARKLDFRPIQAAEARSFLDRNHIQGGPVMVSLAIGAFDGNTLLMVATFGKHHRNVKCKEFVLNRFACEKGVTIVGGLSKASKMAARTLGTDLISWADMSLSQGSGYLSAGWRVEEVLDPDYFYVSVFDLDSRISKQSRRKSAVGTPDNMTEREHAIIDGLFPVYDCGKIRLKYVFSSIS